MATGQLIDELFSKHPIQTAATYLSADEIQQVSAWLDVWKIHVDKEKLRRIPEAVEDKNGNCNHAGSQV